MSTNSRDAASGRTPGDGGELSDERDVRRAVAAHQQDFPYERGEEAQVTRREVCNFLARTSPALFAGAALFAGKAALDSRREAGYPQLKIEGAGAVEPGASLNFRYTTDQDPPMLGPNA